MLCTTCQKIFSGHVDVDNRGRSLTRAHHPDPQSLIRSAAQGCYICNAVYERHLDGGGISKPDLLEWVRYTTYELSFDGTGTATVWIGVKETPKIGPYMYDSYSVKAHISVTKTCHRPFRLGNADPVVTKYEFAPNTESEPCFRLAKHWLSDCLTNHTNCVKTLPINAFHPTRLIEIVPLATASNHKIVLRVADERSQKDPYMTLSHCWGNQSF